MCWSPKPLWLWAVVTVVVTPVALGSCSHPSLLRLRFPASCLSSTGMGDSAGLPLFAAGSIPKLLLDFREGPASIFCLR